MGHNYTVWDGMIARLVATLEGFLKTTSGLTAQIASRTETDLDILNNVHYG